jgi:hypothetical protein
MFSLKKYTLHDKQGDRLIIQPASISDVYSIQGFRLSAPFILPRKSVNGI